MLTRIGRSIERSVGRRLESAVEMHYSAGMSDSATSAVAPPAAFNFAAHLLERNAGRGERIAYRDDDRSLTYADLASRTRRFAAALTALGLRREERVLLVAQDNIDWPVAFLGALYAGVVPVAVNTLLSASDYEYMLNDSRARMAVVSARRCTTAADCPATTDSTQAR